MKKITGIFTLLFLIATGFIFLANKLYPPATSSSIAFAIQPPIIGNTVGPTATVAAATTGLTMSEIAQHSSADDCYLVINNTVYNVSTYLNNHPGGKAVITSRCGKEVTGIFAQIHSNRAWNLLANYQIGKLNQQTKRQKTKIKLNLDTIQIGLEKANPKAQIVNVKPKKNLYIAKVILNNELYEVHIDKNGNIISEENTSSEFDWSLWDTDKDDS